MAVKGGGRVGRRPDLFVFVWFSDNCRLVVFVCFAGVVLLFFIVVAGISRRKRPTDKARPNGHVGILPECHHRMILVREHRKGDLDPEVFAPLQQSAGTGPR
jgi:hypothetical protein